MKKIITYSTPKDFKKSREFSKWISARPKVCKFTKGKHEFKLVDTRKLTFCNGAFLDYECGCGKKKLEFRKDDE